MYDVNIKIYNGKIRQCHYLYNVLFIKRMDMKIKNPHHLPNFPSSPFKMPAHSSFVQVLVCRDTRVEVGGQLS